MPTQKKFSITGAAGNLEGITHLPDSAPRAIAVVAHPLPTMGGTMENKVVTTLAKTFAELGFVALRFNFRGVGDSSGTFDEAREKLEKWADDLVLAAEKALKNTKEQTKIFQRQARLATHLDEQHEIQQKIQKLEKQQRRQRQEVFQVEDSIIEKRDALIDALERRLTQKTESERLFTIEWAVV